MRDEELFRRNIDWNLFKTFDEIVRSGGVTAASQKMNRNQPALSLALKRFEEHFGAPLCQRGPGGFALLEEGEIVAETCRQIARIIEELPARLASRAEDLQGILRMRLVTDVVCPDLDEAVRRFRMRHAGVELALDNGSQETIVRALLANEIDIGIASKRTRAAELAYEPLYAEIHQAYCGRDFRLYGEKIDDLSRHAGEPFLLGDADEPSALKTYRARTGIGRKIAARSDNIAELRRLTILGLGICFLPSHCVEQDVAAGRLWPLTPGRQDWKVDIFLISNPSAPRASLRDHFVSELRAVKQAATPAVTIIHS